MRENTLKQRLEAGNAAFGVMITFPSPQVMEMLGHLGFDWILIDNEHGTITVDNSEDMIRASELTGIAPIIRPVANRPEIIAPFLDRGAWGVQVPHVNTAEEARAVLGSDRYAAEVRESQAKYRQLGIQSVPSMIINGQYLVTGSQPVSGYEQILRDIAKKV